MANRIASSFSLLLLLCCIAWGTDYSSVRTALRRVKTLEQFQAISREFPQLPIRVKDALARAAAGSASVDMGEQAVLGAVNEAEATERMAIAPPKQATADEIAKIKGSAVYRDAGVRKSSNWLAEALRKLLELLTRRSAPTRTELPNVSAPSSLGRILIYIVVGILVSIVAIFLVYAIRHFTWQKRLKRKASALLEDDEPERTVDEWLSLANELAHQGRFREAVRCLYLATLLRFDEANVARFIRSETNWEHLARIQASPLRPPGLDFMPATQAFDKIWYGHQIRGAEDVDRFRIWYSQFTQELAQVKR